MSDLEVVGRRQLDEEVPGLRHTAGAQSCPAVERRTRIAAVGDRLDSYCRIVAAALRTRR